MKFDQVRFYRSLTFNVNQLKLETVFFENPLNISGNIALIHFRDLGVIDDFYQFNFPYGKEKVQISFRKGQACTFNEYLSLGRFNFFHIPFTRFKRAPLLTIGSSCLEPLYHDPKELQSTIKMLLGDCEYLLVILANSADSQFFDQLNPKFKSKLLLTDVLSDIVAKHYVASVEEALCQSISSQGRELIQSSLSR